jgi:hypothetical protein
MKALIGLLAGVAVALLAQFPLEPLADQNDLVHWVQHGLLFWAGIVVGVEIVDLGRFDEGSAVTTTRLGTVAVGSFGSGHEISRGGRATVGPSYAVCGPRGRRVHGQPSCDQFAANGG